MQTTPAKTSKSIRKRDPEYKREKQRERRRDEVKYQAELKKNRERAAAKCQGNLELALKKRKEKNEKQKQRDRAKKLKKQQDMEHKQAMLDDIKAEQLNPLIIEIDPNMTAAEKKRSYQLQLQAIHDQIDLDRYGPEGKPKYESIEEFHFCNEGIHGKNINKLEA